VVYGGRIGPPGPLQRNGAKGFNNPSNAGDLQRPSATVVDLEWPSSTVVHFERPGTTVVDLQWPGSAVVNLERAGTTVVDLQWPGATVVGQELQPVIAEGLRIIGES